MDRRTFLSGIACGGALGGYALARDGQEKSGETRESGETRARRGERTGDSNVDETNEGPTGDEDDESVRDRVADAEGMLVFTYDDSPVEDYTLTYDVHREYDVPGCVAACPGLMEEGDAYLEPDQLREMQADGWDVMSHTYHHRSLGRIELTEPARAGDDRLYVEANRHGAIEDDPLVIFDDESETTATVASRGSDSVGEYVDLAEPLAEPVDPSGYVRYPEAFIEALLERTDDRLESWGLDVTGFVYTYGRYHGVAEDLVRDHHDAVANHRYGGGHNDLEGLDPTTMRRMYVETDKAGEDDVDAFMRTAADEDVLAIVGGHSQFDTLTEDRIRYTIEAALENDLEIVTMAEALAVLDARNE